MNRFGKVFIDDSFMDYFNDHYPNNYPQRNQQISTIGFNELKQLVTKEAFYNNQITVISQA